MNTLETAIRNFERAAEELSTVAEVAALSHKITTTMEQSRELMDRISFAERLGARAEMSILEATALNVAMEIMRKKIALK